MEAAEHGVTDLDAAVAMLLSVEGAPDVALSVAAQYVQAVLMLRVHTNLSKDKAMLPLVLSGNVGIHVHAKGSDAAYVTRLELRKARLAEELKLPLLVDWDESVPEWAPAAEEVRTKMTAHYRQQVEEQVFKRKVVKQNKEQESGHNAVKLVKSMTAIKT